MQLNEDQVREILKEYSKGQNSLMRLLDRHGIHPFDFYEFLNARPDLQNLFERAQIYRVEQEVDQLTEIADTQDNPVKARNMIDVRKWRASKMNPSKYGERLDINVTKTVDIKAAILEGRSRMVQIETEKSDVILPPRYLNKSQSMEVIGSSDSKSDRETVEEPVAQPQVETEVECRNESNVMDIVAEEGPKKSDIDDLLG